jgi:hypothetical protein
MAARRETPIDNLPIARGATPTAGTSAQRNIMIDGISAVSPQKAASAEMALDERAGPTVANSSVIVVAEFAEAVPSSATMAVGGGRAGRVPAPAAASSPASPTRWRIYADGRVQRSTTNGTSWDAVAVSAAVSAGAAPAPGVCWLVGRGGVVLRSTDAQHFERLSFPETVGLLSVRATDARSATVTAADGRQFSTTDGGVSWRLGQ